MTDEFEKRKKEILAPIFFEAGAALYDCQSFEYGIAYLLYLLSRLGASDLDPARCAAILDNDEKKTAGQLIQILRQHQRISEGLEDSLTKALEARNLLIHRYFIENGERMIEVSEHEVLVREIRAHRSTVRRSQKQLDPFVQALAKAIDGAPFVTWAAEIKEKFLRETQEH